MVEEKHNHITEEEVKESLKKTKKLAELNKKSEGCAYCKRILLKYGSE